MIDPPIQGARRFIASHIHKHYLMIGGIDAEQRIVLQPRKVELHRFLTWAKANLLPTDAVVLEATTNAWTIYDQVVGLVARVAVVHPAKVRLIAEARVKTGYPLGESRWNDPSSTATRRHAARGMGTACSRA
jgi:hypothetical protein